MESIRRHAYDFRYVIAGLPLGAVLLWNAPSIGLWLVALSFRDVGGMAAATAQSFLTLALSVLIEATPFLLLGVFVSVIVQNFVPRSAFQKIIPNGVVARRLVMSFTGMLLPVCECGNVPIARSLMSKGVGVGDAITFLLAAPILNPIVLLTTWQAFQMEESIVVGRFVAAFIIANLVALIVTRLLRPSQILTPEFSSQCQMHAHYGTDRSVKGFITRFETELWPLLKLLCFGALIAAAVQTFIPRETLVSIGTDPLMGIIAMILLGFVVSICSSVDAFFALAFARTFTPGAITAFLVAGPMVDIKMVALLRTTFTTRAVALICGLVFVFALATGLIVNWAAGR